MLENILLNAIVTEHGDQRTSRNRDQSQSWSQSILVPVIGLIFYGPSTGTGPSTGPAAGFILKIHWKTSNMVNTRPHLNNFLLYFCNLKSKRRLLMQFSCIFFCLQLLDLFFVLVQDPVLVPVLVQVTVQDKSWSWSLVPAMFPLYFWSRP